MNGIIMEITSRKFGRGIGIGTTTGKKTASETSTGTEKGIWAWTGTAGGTGTGTSLHSDRMQTRSTSMTLFSPSRHPEASF